MLFRFDREFREEFRANWVILLIAFVAFVVSMQLTTYVLPFVYSHVIEEYGWSREQATLIASIKYLFGVASSILAGRLSDTFGPWLLLIGSTILAALSLVAFLWVDRDTLAFYYAIGVVQGIVVPGGYIAMIVILSRTFTRSQGSATGVALMGSTICSIIAPVAVVYAIAAFGWHMGIAAMSTGIWLIALPLMIYGAIFLKQAREGGGGGENDSAAEKRGIADRAVWARLVKSRDFWLIGIAILLAATADQGFRQHQVLIFEDLGISTETAAYLISGIGIAGVVTRVIAGNILDAKSNRGLAFLFVCEAAASLLAFFLAFPVAILLFMMFRATSQSAITLDGGVMAKHIFGLKNLGAVIGILSAFGALGSALGPWLMGVIFDTFGSYKIAFVLFIALPIIGASLTWIVKPHYWLTQTAGQKAA